MPTFYTNPPLHLFDPGDDMRPDSLEQLCRDMLRDREETIARVGDPYEDAMMASLKPWKERLAALTSPPAPAQDAIVRLGPGAE